MDKRQFLKRLDKAYLRVTGEVSANRQGGKYAAGLANEGWAGGYAQALRDVEALLRHGYPGDPRHYWVEAPIQSSAEPEVVGAEGDHASVETRAEHK